MFEFHQDKRKYFEINIANVEKYILPFIEEKIAINPGMRVLEIGCGEGGVLKAFLDRGMVGVGVELDEVRLKDARNWLATEIEEGKVKFISKNIYDTDVVKDLGGRFDIIVLKDVIEHIYDQPKLMAYMQSFLNEKGVIFFGFPPWQMPLGGHQQILKNKWLSKLPYYHLLPMPIYKKILKMAKENVQEMVEIKETGISIEQFEKITKETGYEVINKKHYLINPIYQYKFGWKPKEQFRLVKNMKWVRNFFTTCVYYLITKK
ncbi:MAG: class I SAM-dependent methyltransferase [Bacteroidetes bacterium]|nr:class I SAM-dependent methyltransferase [Bacteroidota bacterium]MBS1757519.1 class I SAM-dependent methyltransferase [Bacteroidota bacterium]